jgi:hypothetical protein
VVLYLLITASGLTQVPIVDGTTEKTCRHSIGGRV